MLAEECIGLRCERLSMNGNGKNKGGGPEYDSQTSRFHVPLFWSCDRKLAGTGLTWLGMCQLVPGRVLAFAAAFE